MRTCFPRTCLLSGLHNTDSHMYLTEAGSKVQHAPMKCLRSDLSTDTLLYPV